jgi:hypothetical protein
MFTRYLILIVVTALILTACSSKGTKIGSKALISNGIRIGLTTDPDPPHSGDNKVIVRLLDAATGEPVVNANVTVSAYNALAGGGDRESGRAQGDGEYDVPIKLPIPDTYKLDVQVQRPAQPDADATFEVTAG